MDDGSQSRRRQKRQTNSDRTDRSRSPPRTGELVISGLPTADDTMQASTSSVDSDMQEDSDMQVATVGSSQVSPNSNAVVTRKPSTLKQPTLKPSRQVPSASRAKPYRVPAEASGAAATPTQVATPAQNTVAIPTPMDVEAVAADTARRVAFLAAGYQQLRDIGENVIKENATLRQRVEEAARLYNEYIRQEYTGRTNQMESIMYNQRQVILELENLIIEYQHALPVLQAFAVEMEKKYYQAEGQLVDTRANIARLELLVQELEQARRQDAQVALSIAATLKLNSVDDLGVTVRKLVDDNQALDADNFRLSQTARDLKGELDLALEETKRLAHELKSVKGSVDTTMTTASEYETENARLREENNQARQRNLDSESRILALRGHIQELQRTEIAARNQAEQAQLARVEPLERDLARLRAELAARAETIDESETKIAELGGQVTLLQAQVRDATLSDEKSTERIAELTNLLDRQRGRIAELEYTHEVNANLEFDDEGLSDASMVRQAIKGEVNEQSLLDESKVFVVPDASRPFPDEALYRPMTPAADRGDSRRSSVAAGPSRRPSSVNMASVSSRRPSSASDSRRSSIVNDTDYQPPTKEPRVEPPARPVGNPSSSRAAAACDVPLQYGYSVDEIIPEALIRSAVLEKIPNTLPVALIDQSTVSLIESRHHSQLLAIHPTGAVYVRKGADDNRLLLGGTIAGEFRSAPKTVRFDRCGVWVDATRTPYTHKFTCSHCSMVLRHPELARMHITLHAGREDVPLMLKAAE